MRDCLGEIEFVELDWTPQRIVVIFVLLVHLSVVVFLALNNNVTLISEGKTEQITNLVLPRWREPSKS